MLRLSKLTDYATVILSHIAKETSQIHTTLCVAEATGIAAPTVSKILKLLVNAKVLVSTRGIKGGYALAKTPEQISVAEIISALEGPIALTECSITHEGCEQASGCGIGGNWALINLAVHNALDAITLADLIKPVSVIREYSIPVASLSR
jgi:FeS assembly SUF system regulator